MFNALTGLALGIIVFAVIIGTGVVVLQKFGTSVASCGTIGGGASTWSESTGLCTNASGTTGSNGGTAATNAFYLTGQLGQSGLAGWAPAVIALAIGLLFIGAFMGRGALGGRKV